MQRTAQWPNFGSSRRPEAEEPKKLPPAVALSDNIPVVAEDQEEPYDSYGNFIGDKGKCLVSLSER